MKKRKQKPLKPFSFVEMSRIVMRTAALTKGDVSNRVTWESGSYELGDTRQITVVMEGMYAALDAVIPARGTPSSDYPGYCLDTASLIPRKGGLGKLSMKLSSASGFAGIITSRSLRTTWEIDNSQIEKPILQHPFFLKADNLEAADHLAYWLAEGDPQQKKSFQYSNPEDGKVYALDVTEEKWAKKILRGVESFLAFAPVVTRTTVYDGRPETGKCGFIEEPDISVSGYKYLKSADRVVQSSDRTWTRTEQWLGADEWDTDIYEEA